MGETGKKGEGREERGLRSAALGHLSMALAPSLTPQRQKRALGAVLAACFLPCVPSHTDRPCDVSCQLPESYFETPSAKGATSPEG
jgi:hypothetical protein